MDMQTKRVGRVAGVRAGGLSPVEICLLVLVIGVLLVAAALSAAPKQSDVRTTTVKVTAGDSLWEIAQRHPVDGLTTGQTVDLLAELNDLDGSGITAGTSLKVPARPSAGTLAMR